MFRCDCVVHVYDEASLAGVRRALTTTSDLRFIVSYGGVDGPLRDELTALAARWQQLTLVDIKAPLGRGAALRAGLGVASAEFVAILDPAGFDAFDSIADATAVLARDDRVDAVVGNRWTAQQPASVRRVLSRAYTMFSRWLFRLDVPDVQSPLKVFRRSVIEARFESLRLFAIGFDVELLYRLRRDGVRFAVVPLSWRNVSRGDISLESVAETFISLLTIRLSHGLVNDSTFLRFLGRHYIIPAMRSYSILVFAWRDPQHPSAGGGEVYLEEQSKFWISAGHKVTWVCQSYRGAPRREVRDGITYERIAPVPWVFGAAAFWYLLKSKRDYNFVIDCMNGIPFFTPLFTTKPKFTLVYHLHAKHFREELRWPLSSLAIFIESKLVPFVYRHSAFVTISESTRRDMEAISMSRFPVTLIHSGVSSELRPGPKHPQPTILYLGRIRRYKRVDNLIAAFAVVKRSVPNARLVIAGSGDDEDRLREIVGRRGIPDVVFAGRVDDAQKAALMREAWVFGMPSSMEGWGIVVMEANASGTPAVAYDVGGLRDCIRSGETGMLVNSDEMFAEALAAVLKDDALRERLSAAAVTWADTFSWRNASAQTLDCLRAAQPWKAVFEPEASGGWRVARASTIVHQEERLLPAARAATQTTVR